MELFVDNYMVLNACVFQSLKCYQIAEEFVNVYEHIKCIIFAEVKRRFKGTERMCYNEDSEEPKVFEKECAIVYYK